LVKDLDFGTVEAREKNEVFQKPVQKNFEKPGRLCTDESTHTPLRQH